MSRLSELTAFYPWFYRVLRNRCLNVLSRRKTAAAYVTADDGDERQSPDPASIFGKQQEQAEVWKALASLKLEFREILALKYMRGYDYETLARLLGIPRGTVMSRLYHARKAFHAAYAGADRVDAALEGDSDHG